MLAVYSTDAIKEADRFDYWHQLTCQYHSLTECERLTEGSFEASYCSRPLGALHVGKMTASTAHMRYKRGPREIRSDAVEDFVLFFVSRGKVGFSQGDREVLLGPGDMMVYHQATPFTFDSPAGEARVTIVNVPPALLTSRAPDIARFTARRIRNGSSRLAERMFRELLQPDIGTCSTHASKLGAAALDIVATALDLEADDLFSQGGQLGKIKQYILANLQDPELTTERIARANHIAPRTLNRLFAADGTTPIRWLWKQRLSASFTALAEGQVTQVTQAAMNYGFNDLSHFSRTFKKSFGCSPHSLKRK